MPTVNKSALVSFSVDQMFGLVSDIEAYPQFLPWCEAAQMRQTAPNDVEATLVISKGALNKSFTTHNHLQANDSITMHLVDGPFRRLEGCWRFEELREQSCRISLHLEFEFASKLLRLAIEPIFNQIANSMVDAFCKRAMVVYGRR